MRRALWAAAGLAVCVAVWALQAAREPPETPAGGAPPRAATSEGPQPTLGPGVEPSAPISLRGRPPVVPRGDLTISGRVVRRDGSAAAGVEVTAAPDLPGAPEVARTITNGAGEFRLDGLPRGLHRLQATLAEGDLTLVASGYASAGYEDSLLTLTPAAGLLEISVMDAAGRPVPRFEARLVCGARIRPLGMGRDGKLHAQVEGRVGRLEVDDLEDAHVEVWGARTAEDLGLPWGAARAGPLQRTTRTVEVRLPAARGIEGKAVLQDGSAPPAGALRLTAGVPGRRRMFMGLALDPLDAAPLVPPSGARSESGESVTPEPFQGVQVSVGTDAEGSFRVPDLGESRPLLLQFSVEGDYLRPREMRVAPDGPPLRIVLRRSVSVEVTVQDPEGQPVVRANVRADPVDGVASDSHDGHSAWGRTDREGRALVSGLDPTGRYVLTVVPWDTTDLTSHMQEGWEPRATVVRLEAGATVSGVVIDGSGAAVEGAYVWIHPDRAEMPERTGPDGAFQFERVPIGEEIRLVTAWGLASAEAPEHLLRGAVRLAVQRGTNRVVLGIDRGMEVHVRIEDGANRPPAPSGSFPSTDALYVLRRDGSVWSRHTAAGLEEGGETGYRVRGLEPGVEYAVWSPPSPRNATYVYAPFSAEAGTLRLRRQGGGSVRLRLDPPPRGDAWEGLLLTDDLGRHVRFPTAAAVGGEIRVQGLPPSTWTVEVLGTWVQGRRWTAPEPVTTGGSLTLRVPWEDGTGGDGAR